MSKTVRVTDSTLEKLRQTHLGHDHDETIRLLINDFDGEVTAPDTDESVTRSITVSNEVHVELLKLRSEIGSDVAPRVGDVITILLRARE